MIRFLLRRILSGILVLFVFLSIAFFATQLLLPGDFVSYFALFMSIEEMEQLREILGLNLPLWQRYLNFVGDLLRLDFGVTYTNFGLGAPITEIMIDIIPATLFVFGIGTILAFLLGQWLGKLVAWRKPGLVTGSLISGSILLYTAFPPWLAWLATYFIYRQFDLGTKLGLRQFDYTRSLWKDAPYDPPQIMMMLLYYLLLIACAFLLVNVSLRRFFRRQIPLFAILIGTTVIWCWLWLSADWQPYAQEVISKAIVPLLVFTLLSFGEVMLIMRSNMIDTLHEQYIKTAWAKGLPTKAVRDRHAARNALLPVISRLVISLPYLLAGTAMIERELGWPGLGTTLFNAVGVQNTNLTVGVLAAIGVISLGARLVLDVTVALLDPRVRFTEAGANGF